MGPFWTMRTWTATATAEAHPEAILHVLTDPDAASRWAPVPFDVEDDRRVPSGNPSERVAGRRLKAGSRARVSGRLAGRRVGFEVEVHAADANGLALTATGPVEFDVDYRLAPTTAGAEVHASISVRPRRGLTGRLLAEATSALLNAGALNHALSRLTREAALSV